MVMKKLDVRLLRMIKHSKGQFISVTVIVAAALCIYVLFNVTSININDAVDSYYAMTNINDIQVQLVKIPKTALDELKSIEGIQGVQGRVAFDVPLRVENADEKVSIRLISIPPTGEEINKLHWPSGHPIKVDNDNLIVLEQFAVARNIKSGDSITPYINGREHHLKVSGIAASSEFIYLMENEQTLLPVPDKFGIAYVSEGFAQSAYGYLGSYNEVLITVKDNVNIDDIIEKLENKLDKYGVKRITKLEDQLSNNVLVQKIDGIEQMSNIIPVMFLMIAAIIIVIMLSRIVANDRMAIGVLKALGYGSFDVLFHYTKYALAIGLIGSIIGITGGILLSGPLSQVFVTFFNIPFVTIRIYYSFIFKAIMLTSIFCVASGLLGAKTVMHIMPADSMRPEAPKSGKRILLERIGFIWSRVSFSWKMVIRNIMRTKKRFTFLVFGLALTYSINVVPLYMGESMPTMFNLQYGEYQKMDYNIDFAKPMNKSVLNDLNHLIETSRMEPRLEYPFELKNEWRKKSVNFIGIPRDTGFYHFRDMNDKVVTLKKEGLFITEALAKALDVNQGDYITIKNFIPNKKDIKVEVTGVVKQYLGINAFMDIEAMQNLLVDKEMITGVSIASTDDVKEKLTDIKNIAAVRSSDEIQNAFLEYLDTMIIATRLYLIFGGILSFAIIYNATIIGISERNMEFASLRVLGFDKKDIYRMISKENALMTGIAILLGIPLGMSMINGMAESFSSEMITFPIIAPPKIFIFAAIATISFAIIAQVATRKKIYNLNFIDALKSRIS
jgi:putative ABC transport system permease protein